MMIKKLIVLTLLFVVAFGSTAQEEKPAEPAPEAAPEAPPAPPPIALEGDEARRNDVNPLQGQPAPPLSIASWANTEGVNWEQLKGQVVLLDFWGVWCAPCRAAVPHLKELQAAHKDKGLTIVAVHTTNSADNAPAFIAQQEIGYIVGYDDANKTVSAYKVDSYPDIYLVDHTGVLRYADAANGDWANITNAVTQLLAEREKAMAPAPEPAPAPAEPAPAPAPEPAPAEAAPAAE